MDGEESTNAQYMNRTGRPVNEITGSLLSSSFSSYKGESLATSSHSSIHQRSKRSLTNRNSGHISKQMKNLPFEVCCISFKL
jgi:hypothetical protein